MKLNIADLASYRPLMDAELKRLAKVWSKSDEALQISPRSTYIVSDLIIRDYGKLFGDVVRERQTLETVKTIFNVLVTKGYLSTNEIAHIQERLDSFV